MNYGGCTESTVSKRIQLKELHITHKSLQCISMIMSLRVNWPIHSLGFSLYFVTVRSTATKNGSQLNSAH